KYSGYYQSNSCKHGSEEDVYRALQLIAQISSDRTNSLRCKHQGSDDCAAKLLRHAKFLNAVIQRNSELFRQQNHDDQIKNQHRRMKSCRLHVQWVIN